MKTKIVYISGNELHNPDDIRAVFDEIRGALGLGLDTVLFAVPTDEAVVSDQLPVTSDVTGADIIRPQEPVVEVPKPKKTRAKKEKIIESTTTYTATDTVTVTDTDTVIPILSVLSGKGADAPADEPIEPAEPVDEPAAAPVQTVAIDDIELGDVPTPVMSSEKTLEELLENLTPLREDINEEIIFAETVSADNRPTTEDSRQPTDDGRSMTDDETLAKLASEFAQAQDILNADDDDDAVAAPVKSPAKSSIGKLKNILPFKKAKSDSGALLGDLFGWAGVAANDDEFSVPGFFAKAGSNQ
jgi:hypothetical protein